MLFLSDSTSSLLGKFSTLILVPLKFHYTTVGSFEKVLIIVLRFRLRYLNFVQAALRSCFNRANLFVF